MATLQTTLTRPKLDEDVIPFSEYRQNLTRYFKQTQRTHRPILVTQNGRAATIVMNVADPEHHVDQPRAGRESPEFIGKHPTVRDITIGNYRLFYRIKRTCVEIISIHNCKQQITSFRSL